MMRSTASRAASTCICRCCARRRRCSRPRRRDIERRVQGVFRRARRRQEFRRTARHRLSRRGQDRRGGRARSATIRATHGVEQPIYPATSDSDGGRRSCCSSRSTGQSQPASATTCSPTRCGARRSRRRSRPASRARRAVSCSASRQCAQTFPGFLVFVRLEPAGAGRRSATRRRQRFPLCRLPHAGPVQDRARQVPAAAGPCRGLSTATWSRTTAVQSRDAARRRIRRRLARHPQAARRRPAMDCPVPADRRLSTRPSSRGDPGACSACSACCLPARSRCCRAIRRVPMTRCRSCRRRCEKSLLEKDLMLQEMKHRIKNSITRVLAIARQTAARAKDIDGILGILLGAAAGDGGLAGHADPLALAEGRSRRAAAHRA